MSCRSTPGIAPRESNKYEGYLFMYLYTGKEIHINEWTELTIYDDIVKRLEELEKKEKQPTFDQYPMFEWIPGIPIIYDMT